MTRWLYNFIVDVLRLRKTGKIEINIFDGGISSVNFTESHKQPQNAKDLSLV